MFTAGFTKTAVSGKYLSDWAAKAALTHMGYNVSHLPPKIKDRMIRRMKDHMYDKGVVFWSSTRSWNPHKGTTVRHTANKRALKDWVRAIKEMPHRSSDDGSRLHSGVKSALNGAVPSLPVSITRLPNGHSRVESRA